MREFQLKEGLVAYHGSEQDNPSFSDKHTGNNSHTFGSYDSDRYGVFFSDNPDFANMYGSVQKYDLNISNTASDLGELSFQFRQTLDAHGPSRDVWIYAANYQHEWQLFEDDLGELFVPWLIKQGYDSATFEEWNEDDDGNEHKSNTIVVFDPKRIRKIR